MRLRWPALVAGLLVVATATQAAPAAPAAAPARGAPVNAAPVDAAVGEPVLLLGGGPNADAVGAALAATGEQVSVVSAAETAAALTRTDVTLLATTPAACATLPGAQTPHRACVLVRRDAVPVGVAAVLADAAWATQLARVGHAFAGRTRVVVLRAPGDAVRDAALSGAAAAAHLTLVLVDVRAPGETVPAFLNALRAPGGAAILLAVPDAAVLTADTVAPLTQAALSARVPLVGFSSYFLKIGSLGAFTADTATAALRAVVLARTQPGTVEEAPSATLVVDGRLAQRLGIPVRGGPGVEVRK